MTQQKKQGSLNLSTRSSDPAAQDLDALELFSGNARLTEAFRGVLNEISLGQDLIQLQSHAIIYMLYIYK